LLVFFLSKPQAWYIIRRKSVYHQGRLVALVSHHASACISLRLDDILAKSEIYSRFCADDIQHFVLMIYTPNGVIKKNEIRLLAYRTPLGVSARLAVLGE